MAKSIEFEYDGTAYVLEYNRRALRMLDEKYKFSIEDIEKLQVSKIPDLFYCAFVMHHPTVKRETVDAIWDSMGDKGELVGALGEMYVEVIESMMGEPEKGKPTSWRMNG